MCGGSGGRAVSVVGKFNERLALRAPMNSRCPDG